MRALCWHGKSDVRVDTVPDPTIEDPRDAIIKITTTCICGSDLHLYDGYMPTMEAGDVLGHEPMGVVVEVGKDVKKLKKGDRVVVPFTISCGECWYCKRTEYSLCDRTNRDAEIARKMMGQAPAGLFGYSHMTGAYPGGQAEYLRVPYADVGPLVIPDELPDEKVVFLSDIFPTGYMAAENAQIQPGDTVAVWGCGPVAQFAIRSAWMLGAGRVIAIDTVPERLEMARQGKAETIDFEKQDVYDTLMEMTKGKGPDSCIDAVGAEAHAGGSVDAVMDKAKAAVGLATDRAARAARGDHVLPQGRHGVDPRRLHRLPGQAPLRRGDEQGPDLQDGPDPRAALHRAAAGEDPVRGDRPLVRDHARGAAREGARDVQDLPRQEGQVHQGRPEAVNLADPGRHRAMASRSSSVEARVSAFRTRFICSSAWRFSSSVLEATQSPGTISPKSRM